MSIPMPDIWELCLPGAVFCEAAISKMRWEIRPEISETGNANV
jgi:hypothetical protein